MDLGSVQTVEWKVTSMQHGSYITEKPTRYPPDFNSSPLESYLPNGKEVFQPPFFTPRLCLAWLPVPLPSLRSSGSAPARSRAAVHWRKPWEIRWFEGANPVQRRRNGKSFGKNWGCFRFPMGHGWNQYSKKSISLDLLEEVLGKMRSYAPKWSNGGLPW